jgi:hypothetical protein
MFAVLGRRHASSREDKPGSKIMEKKGLGPKGALCPEDSNDHPRGEKSM